MATDRKSVTSVVPCTFPRALILCICPLCLLWRLAHKDQTACTVVPRQKNVPGLRSAPVLLLPDKSNELVAGLISAKAVEIETAAYRGLDRVFPVVLSHVRTTQRQAFK